MKKKEHIFIGNSHEFDFKVNESDDIVKYKLKRSSNSDWTNPNELVLTAIDDPDNFEIEINGTKYSYSDFKELYLLMHGIVQHDKNLIGKIKFV